MRVGIGHDVHQLIPGRKLILGGVDIPHDKGLLGHSDADVLVHAVCDALLGAAGLGDIGIHFPDSDDAFKGISSLKLLHFTLELIRAENFGIVNLDATILAQAPRLGPFRTTMEKNIAEVLGLEKNRVNIKFTTTEGLGFVGRGEGIQADCMALLKAL